jgi:hypothetical protein
LSEEFGTEFLIRLAHFGGDGVFGLGGAESVLEGVLGGDGLALGGAGAGGRRLGTRLSAFAVGGVYGLGTRLSAFAVIGGVGGRRVVRGKSVLIHGWALLVARS